jgi:hypothetical protein
MGQRLIDLQPQKWPKVTKPNEAASRLWTLPTRQERRHRPDSGRSDTGQSAASVQSWTLSVFKWFETDGLIS